MGPYNVTKAGVIGLSETLRSELSPDHIGVTVLCPFFVETNLDKAQSHTDDFQLQLHVTAAQNARMSADEVTRIALRAARRGRLYSIPQLSARLWWLDKRISPTVQNSAIAFLYKMGVARPLVMWLARHGLT
jgi:short-subunit dehydrogenase